MAREAFVEATALAAEAEAEEECGACFEPLWALEDGGKKEVVFGTGELWLLLFPGFEVDFSLFLALLLTSFFLRAFFLVLFSSSCFFFLRELQQKQKRTAPPMSAQTSTTMRRISSRSLELPEVVEEEFSFFESVVFEASSSEDDECPVVPFDEVEDQ